MARVATKSSPARLVLIMGAVTIAVILVTYAVLVSLKVNQPQISGNQRSSEPMVGKAAPSFTLQSLSGAGPVQLASFRGKPVILNFFASWCAPCKAELPFFASTAQRGAGGVTFVGVDEDDSLGSARALVAKDGVGYTVAFDPNESLSSAYRLFGFPTTLAVAANGKVVGEVAGQISQAQLNQLVVAARTGRMP